MGQLSLLMDISKILPHPTIYFWEEKQYQSGKSELELAKLEVLSHLCP